MPMLLLVGVSFVMATMAVVSIAVATVRVMAHVEKAADEFAGLARELQRSLVHANELIGEARQTLASVRRIGGDGSPR